MSSSRSKKENIPDSTRLSRGVKAYKLQNLPNDIEKREK